MTMGMGFPMGIGIRPQLGDGEEWDTDVQFSVELFFSCSTVDCFDICVSEWDGNVNNPMGIRSE